MVTFSLWETVILLNQSKNVVHHLVSSKYPPGGGIRRAIWYGFFYWYPNFPLISRCHWEPLSKDILFGHILTFSFGWILGLREPFVLLFENGVLWLVLIKGFCIWPYTNTFRFIDPGFYENHLLLFENGFFWLVFWMKLFSRPPPAAIYPVYISWLINVSFWLVLIKGFCIWPYTNTFRFELCHGLFENPCKSCLKMWFLFGYLYRFSIILFDIAFLILLILWNPIKWGSSFGLIEISPRRGDTMSHLIGVLFW